VNDECAALSHDEDALMDIDNAASAGTHLPRGDRHDGTRLLPLMVADQCHVFRCICSAAYVQSMRDSRPGNDLRRISGVRTLFFALALGVLSSASVFAQTTVLKVIGSDTVPVPFAWVSVEGGTANITDEKGTVSLGAIRHKTLTVEVRRIGYQPWFGKLDFPDTAAVLTVTLPRLAQQLAGVTVTGQVVKTQLELVGFYDRWMQRQKGTLSATFIGPEELEKRHPSRTTDMLYGLNGISIVRGSNGAMCARGNGGSCFMTVLIDGNVLRPSPPTQCSGPSTLHIGSRSGPSSAAGPDINMYIDANEVAAIEVYARGGNMPISLQAADNACGVIAIWTGSRK
jgi:hypothetical protein